MKRSPIGTAICALIFHWAYIPWFLGQTAEDLELDLPSVWGRDFGIAWLRAWGAAVERATAGRITARSLLWRVPLYPVGFPMIQHALNQRYALPEARALEGGAMHRRFTET